jgi:hypothetical protein
MPRQFKQCVLFQECVLVDAVIFAIGALTSTMRPPSAGCPTLTAPPSARILCRMDSSVRLPKFWGSSTKFAPSPLTRIERTLLSIVPTNSIAVTASRSSPMTKASCALRNNAIEARVVRRGSTQGRSSMHLILVLAHAFRTANAKPQTIPRCPRGSDAILR